MAVHHDGSVMVVIVVLIPSGCWNGRNVTATLTVVIAADASDVSIVVHALLLGMLFGHYSHHLLVTTGFVWR